MQRNRQPQLAAVDDLLDLLRERLEARPHGLHEEDVVLLCGGEEGLELCGVRGDGLFAEDVLLGLEGGEGGGVVVGVGSTWGG